MYNKYNIYICVCVVAVSLRASRLSLGLLDAEQEQPGSYRVVQSSELAAPHHEDEVEALLFVTMF